MRSCTQHRGFTLLELLITIAVAAIALSIAVPSFQDLINDNRVATAGNDLLADVLLARSEAVKREARVVLCKSQDLSRCTTSGGWEQGWIVFLDPNNNAQVDTGEPIFSVHEALQGVTITGNRPVADYISYVSTGRSRKIDGSLQNGTLTITAADKTHQLIISSTGRPRIQS